MATAGAETGLPRARAEGLLCRSLPDGKLVYDTVRHQAHSLNRTATFIWDHCDGSTAMSELVELLRQEGLPADPDLVWLALDRLDKAHLLAEPFSAPAREISRRAIMRKLGLAGGLAALFPLIESLAPPPARAATSSQIACVPAGQPCDQHGLPCCKGVCDCDVFLHPQAVCVCTC